MHLLRHACMLLRLSGGHSRAALSAPASGAFVCLPCSYVLYTSLLLVRNRLSSTHAFASSHAHVRTCAVHAEQRRASIAHCATFAMQITLSFTYAVESTLATVTSAAAVLAQLAQSGHQVS